MVVVGGEVKSHKGVNLPGVPVPIPSLTKKDLDDLAFALGLGVDFVALSFVRAAADVRDLQAIIRQHGSPARVIAKIEKAEAVAALDEVLLEADAVMVARGDLGVEIGAATVPLLQKRIILRCLEAGKPVITATQMLESMIEHAEPTRAEASDVANAVLDGTSAVMLSAETATGNYPVQAVEMMDRIARAVEPSMGYRHQMPEAGEEPTVGRAMSNAACDLAEALGARAILVPDVHRAHRVGGGPAAPPAPDSRAVAPSHRGAADGARVGRDAGVDAAERRRRGPLVALARVRAQVGDGRGRRPCRPHRRHRRQPAGLDQRDQGRRRVAT